MTQSSQAPYNQGMTSPTAARPAWSSILFDLDGTLVDSAPGIVDRLARTLSDLGLPVPDQAGLLAYVGPPLLDALREFAGLSEERAWEALHLYREKARAEGAESGLTVFPGVLDVLRRVHAAGIPLGLATSKPESQAFAIIEALGVRDLFTAMCGASEDEVRSAKTDVVAEALIRLRAAGADTSRPVLVGDREHDVSGGAANGVPTIFVDWGYGTDAEAAPALARAANPDELTRLLLG